MKNETPFNPLPLPDNLTLELNAGATQEQASNPEPERPTRRKPRKKSTKTKQSSTKASKADNASKWNRIKGRLAAKVAEMDKEKLKAVLLASGVALGIVAAAVAAIKLMPLAVLILAILGLGAALRFWERLSFLPRPF